ncbi:hypothetical protein [Glaciibacter psychrotolerans]|uniref:Positive regulator of sigma E activity n=1 Tax=Glaciibacter psychrotolerans TaxID=670054 RepID=A0A7Z0EFM9_9MICO|nr:hypothetical protein [Leifsonia psychrotolerans]NYJ20566.1 positive regulator of sigma E activity [Leifsonia psychrotolerans]
MTGAAPDSGSGRPSGSRWIKRAARGSAKPVTVVLGAYGTEYAIYGTVLVSALIAVGWKFDTDFEVLLFTLGTVVVFWIAHIYSGVVANNGSVEARNLTLGKLILNSARHSIGMVLAMLVPALFLLLAAARGLDEYVAYYIALWAGVATLAVLGYWNSVKRGNRWARRILNAAITASLGVGIIWLSYLVH